MPPVGRPRDSVSRGPFHAFVMGTQWTRRVAQRAHPWMRKRATQVATTQMGRMGAEDPVGIASGISDSYT